MNYKDNLSFCTCLYCMYHETDANILNSLPYCLGLELYECSFNREVGYLITLFFIDYEISSIDNFFFSVCRRYKMSCKPLCLCDAKTL